MSLATCSMRDRPATGRRIAAVRYGMGRQRAWRNAGIEWVPALAPSASLLRWWRAGPASGERWREYVGRWKRERAESEGYWARVGELAGSVSRGETIVLACWCRDESRCHRSLVAADVLSQARSASRKWTADDGITLCKGALVRHGREAARSVRGDRRN